MFGDGVAVCGSCQQGAEDEDVERALQEFYTGGRLLAHSVVILLYVV